MVLTFSTLELTTKTNPEGQRIFIEKEAGKWVVSVQYEQAETSRQFLQVQTTRGAVKTWRFLEDALSNLRQQCPSCEAVSVLLAGEVWNVHLTKEVAA